MRIDTVRIGYGVPKSTPIGYFEAGLAPEGWRDSRYVNNTDMHLVAKEINEFASFVNSFMHDLPTQKDLHKYAEKHGADTDAVTRTICFECALMIYVVHVNGYAITIYPYRKENA